MKGSWPRLSEPQSYYVITIVKFSNRSIQNLFNFDISELVWILAN